MKQLNPDTLAGALDELADDAARIMQIGARLARLENDYITARAAIDATRTDYLAALSLAQQNALHAGLYGAASDLAAAYRMQQNLTT